MTDTSIRFGCYGGIWGIELCADDALLHNDLYTDLCFQVSHDTENRPDPSYRNLKKIEI